MSTKAFFCTIIQRGERRVGWEVGLFMRVRAATAAGMLPSWQASGCAAAEDGSGSHLGGLLVLLLAEVAGQELGQLAVLCAAVQTLHSSMHAHDQPWARLDGLAGRTLAVARGATLACGPRLQWMQPRRQQRRHAIAVLPQFR